MLHYKINLPSVTGLTWSASLAEKHVNGRMQDHLPGGAGENKGRATWQKSVRTQSPLCCCCTALLGKHVVCYHR